MATNRDQLLESDRLRVRFWFCQDRYAHEIWLAVAGEWIAMLASAEGSPSEDWPASPPFQSLHFEQQGTAQQSALLVGMAGKSHWSASIELDPAGTARGSTSLAESVARTAPELASTYRTTSGVSTRRTHDGKLELNAPSLVNMSLELASPQESPRASVEHIDGAIRIVADDPSSSDSSRTVRWRYGLRVVESPSTTDR